MIFILIWIFRIQVYFVNVRLIIYEFSNAFVFPDPEPPIINIRYGWLGIYGQLGLWFTLFSVVIKFIHQNLSFIIYSTLLFLLYKVPPKPYDTIILFVLPLLILLYLFPPKSCDTIILFALSLWYFCYTFSLQSLVTQSSYLYCHSDILVLNIMI